MTFSTTYVIAGEVFKVMIPSLLAFFAWWQSKGNQKVIGEVKEKMSEADTKVCGTAEDIVKLNEGVQELRITVDGRLSQLLKLTESSAFARGMLEPKLEQLLNPEKPIKTNDQTE